MQVADGWVFRTPPHMIISTRKGSRHIIPLRRTPKGHWVIAFSVDREDVLTEEISRDIEQAYVHWLAKEVLLK